MAPWIDRALQRELPAANRTGRYIIPAQAPTLDELDALAIGTVGTARRYCAADLQAAWSRECAAGRDSDDAAERVARSLLR